MVKINKLILSIIELPKIGTVAKGYLKGYLKGGFEKVKTQGIKGGFEKELGVYATMI